MFEDMEELFYEELHATLLLDKQIFHQLGRELRRIKF